MGERRGHSGKERGGGVDNWLACMLLILVGEQIEVFLGNFCKRVVKVLCSRSSSESWVCNCVTSLLNRNASTLARMLIRLTVS